MKLRAAFFLLMILHCLALSGQPANDDCQFAQVLILPPSGQLCVSGTNLNATPDGIFSPCNAPGGGNEVWYTFVASGNNTIITVSPAGGVPAQTLVVSVPDGNCYSTINLICQTAATPGGNVSINPLSLAGQQIWFEVSSLTGDGEFEICISSSTPPAGAPGDSCSGAISFCSKGSFTYMGPTLNSSGLIPSCWPPVPPPTGDVNHDMWFKFTVGKSGSLVWRATPLAATEFDWALYDITNGCPGIELACNYAFGGPFDPFGMDSSSIGCLFSQYCPPINVVAGNTYAIMIDDFSGLGSPLGFDFEWGGTFGMLPSALFSIDNPTGCGALSTSFTDSSGASPMAVYTWDFGNGNTSNLRNPPVQNYNSPGNYIVTLAITDTTGCTSYFSQDVTVSNYVPGEILADTLICSGSNDTVSYSGSVNDSLDWNFGSATILSGSGAGPYIIQWPAAGQQNITLTVVDTATDCYAVLSHDVTVINGVSASLSVSATACLGDTLLVTYTGQPADTLIWDFGNANIISGSGFGPYTISWNIAGNDTIRVTALVAGCAASVAAVPVSIVGIPTALFTLPAIACTDEVVALNFSGVSSPGATFTWNFGTAVVISGSGQGPFTLSWSSAGMKYLSLSINDNGCSSTIFEDSILIEETPLSTFEADTVLLCGNETVLLSYTGNAGAMATYNWNFDGGNIVSGNGAGPYEINWASPGLKNISLYVEQNACFSDTTELIIDVGIQPVANAGPDQSLCSGDSIQLGTPLAGPFDFLWMPANGLSSDTIAQPMFGLFNPGPADMVLDFLLQVSDRHCRDTSSVQVTVNAVQQAVIQSQVGQCLDGNNFNFQIAAPILASAGFLWDFGPNALPASSNVANPSNIVFSTSGPQLISLTTTTPGCGSETDTLTVFVYPMPEPDFTADIESGCPPLSVQFSDASLTTAGSTYLWNFGSAGISTQQNPLITFNESGFYDVGLTLTSVHNCSATTMISNMIEVLPKPQGDLYAEPLDPLIIDPVVNFYYNSSDTVQCFYDFGDGSSSNDCNPEHKYPDVGSYLVQLVVTNSLGCSDTLYELINVSAFYSLYAPSAFSPNSDGRNDVFTPYGYGISEYLLSIYDRWGKLIFESDNMNIGWNGDYNNDAGAVPEGVYVYNIFTRDEQGRKHNKIGTVTLVR